jgi:hypothetical protein
MLLVVATLDNILNENAIKFATDDVAANNAGRCSVEIAVCSKSGLNRENTEESSH